MCYPNLRRLFHFFGQYYLQKQKGALDAINSYEEVYSFAFQAFSKLHSQLFIYYCHTFIFIMLKTLFSLLLFFLYSYFNLTISHAKLKLKNLFFNLKKIHILNQCLCYNQILFTANNFLFYYLFLF